jgi:hypothetical protein
MKTRRKISAKKSLESVWVIRQIVDGIVTYSNGKRFYPRMVNRNFKFFTSEEAVISHIALVEKEREKNMLKWKRNLEPVYEKAEIVKINLKEDSAIPFAVYGK